MDLRIHSRTLASVFRYALARLEPTRRPTRSPYTRRRDAETGGARESRRYSSPSSLPASEAAICRPRPRFAAVAPYKLDVIELTGLNEDLVTKHEIRERARQRLRRVLEHIDDPSASSGSSRAVSRDDDAIVGPHSSTLQQHACNARRHAMSVIAAQRGLLPSPAASRRPGEAAPSRRTALPASTRFRAAPR